MRYIIFFKDKTTLHVKQEIGEQLISALQNPENSNVLIHGAWYSKNFINMVKPIAKPWFSSEFIEQQKRVELLKPDSISTKLLSSTEFYD